MVGKGIEGGIPSPSGEGGGENGSRNASHQDPDKSLKTTSLVTWSGDVLRDLFIYSRTLLGIGFGEGESGLWISDYGILAHLKCDVNCTQVKFDEGDFLVLTDTDYLSKLSNCVFDP